MNANPLQKLASLGQSIWLDFIQRKMLISGELAQMIERDAVTGITSNPAIFEKAINGSNDYDEAIRELAAAGHDKLAIYERLAIDDVRGATDLFRGVYDRTHARDGYVSLEVSPHLANDADGTIEEARRLWKAVGRPNLMIKVPATTAGLTAIEQLICEGINVNVTLLFSLERYRRSAEAYLAGLRRRVSRGKPLDRIASVASFFLSRIDTAIDPMLEQFLSAGGAKADAAAALLGKTAVASGKAAYRIYCEVFAPKAFDELAAWDAKPQRLLWASTSTKNPAYSDVMYVEPLIAPETVNTLPLETLTAYRDHGQPAARLEEGLDEAEQLLKRLPELGINLDKVTARLETEGIQKFIDPFDKLLDSLEKHRLTAV
ncbi:MAG TPA: transaldolase [Thermoguttaceae bacterium]|nr:transaldolase [Thermoguttaceae bacterium]